MLNNTKKRKITLKFKKIFTSQKGYSIPMVMLLMLVLVIIGGAIAGTVIQMHKTSRADQFELLTYFASESALERSVCLADNLIDGIAEEVLYTDDDDFVDSVIAELGSQISDFYIQVVPTSLARSKVSLSRGPKPLEKDGNEITFEIVFDARSDLESDIYKHYGRRVVTVQEFTVTIPDTFRLNGAVYSIGDVVAKGDRGIQHTRIIGDVYAFGTGLDRANSMQQHYNGGICAIENAEMRIIGNAFSNSLVRAGMFDEIEGEPGRSTIIVHNDIVAQGVQVFGNNDYIVCDRDVYTFDDVELNGPNSFIGIRGDYYGLSKGDGYWHDASSAVLNMAPLYSDSDGFRRSRIIINGNAFINGEVFRLKDDGGIDHKLENAALAWDGNTTLQDSISFTISENTPETRTLKYKNRYKSIKNSLKGSSILIQAEGWDDYLDPKAWMEGIIFKLNTSLDPNSNNISGITIPDKIKGYCKFAMSANDKVYTINPLTETNSDIVYGDLPAAGKLKYAGVKENFWDNYFIQPWHTHNDNFSALGMESALTEIQAYLQNHISVFAYKQTNSLNPEVQYHSNTNGFSEIYDNVYTLFTKQDSSKRKYFLYYPDDGVVENVNISNYITYPTINVDPYNPDIAFADGDVDNPADGVNDYYFIVINPNPDRTIVVSQEEINAIIISKGQVIVSTGGKVNGAILAAGKGYDESGALVGSSADGDNRLPRVKLDNPISIQNFKNFRHAGVVFQSGGSVEFPGRDPLLDKFDNQGIDLTKVFWGEFNESSI